MMQEKSRTKILLVGGGTGGHFYPLIALAEHLNTLSPRPELYYAGPDAYDKEALAVNQITHIYIPAGKRRRYFSILNFLDMFKTLFGCLVAVIRLFILYPDVVMSKGGYTSVPVILAATFLRIPIIVHESDAVMGSANKLGSRFARHIVTAYSTLTLPKSVRGAVHHLGIPIRRVLHATPSQNAIATLSIDAERPLILVLGGSQGAERINTLILDSLDELLVDFSIIHQTGKQNFELVKLSADKLIPDTERRQHYHPIPFLDGALLNDAYHLAYVVISRAGSNSIYEIALHGKPSILIPIPEGISHDQRTNAYTYARESNAIVIEEDNLTDSLLRAEIDRIMQNEEAYASMVQGAKSFAKHDTAERIGELITGIAQEH